MHQDFVQLSFCVKCEPSGLGVLWQHLMQPKHSTTTSAAEEEEEKERDKKAEGKHKEGCKEQHQSKRDLASSLHMGGQ